LLPDERAASGEPLDLGGQRVIGFTYEDSRAARPTRRSSQLDNFDLSLFDREDLMGGADARGVLGLRRATWPRPGGSWSSKLKGFNGADRRGPGAPRC
jgi:hypothetical protein